MEAFRSAIVRAFGPMMTADQFEERAMSATTLSAKSARRGAAARRREKDALSPARGIMVGFGLSALIWTGLAALFLR